MATLNLNQINLVGRIGQDPEIKYFDSGSVLAKVNLAVNRRKKPNEHNASHSMLLTVNNALPVVVTKTQPSPTAQPQPVDQPSPTAQSQPSDESNLPNEVNSDDPIPF